MKRLVALLCLFILNVSVSQAASTIDIVESAGDVVATASGTVNTDSFTPYPGGGSDGLTFGSGLDPKYDGVIYVGSAVSFNFYDIVTDNVFSTGTYFPADSNSGQFLGLFSVNALASFSEAIVLPDGYVSGDALSATSTWTGKTIAGLGLIPGTYVFNWGSGETADSLTLNIDVSPAATYTVGGSVSDLSGSGLVLQNNGEDDLAIDAGGEFTFDTPLEDGSSYSVTVLSQPISPNQTCSIGNSSGTLAGANVIDVTVTCVTKPENVFTDGFEG